MEMVMDVERTLHYVGRMKVRTLEDQINYAKRRRNQKASQKLREKYLHLDLSEKPQEDLEEGEVESLIDLNICNSEHLRGSSVSVRSDAKFTNKQRDEKVLIQAEPYQFTQEEL
jgi:hypothetical protein